MAADGSKIVTIRLTEEEYSVLQEVADKEDRTTGKQATRLLKKVLEGIESRGGVS